MKKDCLDDLSEWLASHLEIKQSTRGSVKIAFLAVKDDVKTALDAGYPCPWSGNTCATPEG